MSIDWSPSLGWKGMLGSSSVVVVISSTTCLGLWYLSLLLSPAALTDQPSQGPHSESNSLVRSGSPPFYSPSTVVVAPLPEEPGETQQSSFSWKYAANCLQLLFPQTWRMEIPRIRGEGCIDLPGPHYSLDRSHSHPRPAHKVSPWSSIFLPQCFMRRK